MEWYAVEENNIYVSKFYWDDGVKESVAVIHDPYYDWLGDNMSYGDELEDCDSDVWFFLENANVQWQAWDDSDGFKRYEQPAHDVKCPFFNVSE